MTFKKSFAAAGVATAIAISGTSVAFAEEETSDELPSSTPTAGSAEASANRDVFGSITGADALGSWTGDQFDYGKAVVALASIAGAAASIKGIADAYTAVVDASDVYQGVLDDTRGFLQSQGLL